MKWYGLAIWHSIVIFGVIFLFFFFFFFESSMKNSFFLSFFFFFFFFFFFSHSLTPFPYRSPMECFKKECMELLRMVPPG